MARIYVGTYAKYNSDSIKGAWLDLEDYADLKDFYEACNMLHEDEEDPEFMFQDFEGIPPAFISESSLIKDIYEWVDLDDDEKEIVAAYLANCGSTGDVSQDISNAQEAYQGEFDSWGDFAEELFSDIYEIPDYLECYINWEAVGRDLHCDYFEQDGHWFRNM